MDDTPEMIRQQMRETRLHLSEKLKSLEQQVSDTVESTGTAVNSTMRAVNNVVHCVSNALDIRRQIDRHPWLVFGGAVVLGYLAVEFMKGPAKATDQMPAKDAQPTPVTHIPSQENVPPALDSSNKATAAAIESRIEKSSSHQLRDAAIGTLIAVMEGVAVSAVPRIVDYLTDDPAASRTKSSEQTGERQRSLRSKESPEVAQRFPIASSSNVRSRKSF